MATDYLLVIGRLAINSWKDVYWPHGLDVTLCICDDDLMLLSALNS